MKAEFERQLNRLLGAEKERVRLITDERYMALIAETKEAKERRRMGWELSGIHYRRLKRFDVVEIGGDSERLVQKNEKSPKSKNLYYCMASEMFDVVHKAHLKIGHKKEKGMELELKRKYCNITREVIAIYLNLCKPCTLKRRSRVNIGTAKHEAKTDFRSRSEVNIIDMEANPDGRFKFILVYQDQRTKFLVLRPLKTKAPNKVADIIFDIFCLLGVPDVLVCPNNRGYGTKIRQSLLEDWNLKDLIAEPTDSSSSSVSEDIQKSILEWMSRNKTGSWANGLRIIQSQKNSSFHQSMKRIPREAAFGTSRSRIVSNPKKSEDTEEQTKDELKEQLALLKRKLEEVNEIGNKMMKRKRCTSRNNKDDEKSDKCLSCKKAFNPDVVCWRCNGPLHFNCALTDDSSENPFCRYCAGVSEKAFQKHGEQIVDKGSHKKEAKPSVFNVGDKVMITMSRIDSDRISSGKGTSNKKIATKGAILEKLFLRNESRYVDF